MKTTITRLGGWSTAALALALSTTLAFLYIRTQDSDESIYFENVALLRQIKQIDARWESDVLKAKIGLTANYDPLVDPLQDLDRLGQRVEAIARDGPRAESSAIAAAGAALRRAIEEKTRLVEDFKSHNSVLRNSLEFLPTAAEDVGYSATHSLAPDRRSVDRALRYVDGVLLASMVYAQAPSEEKAADVRTGVAALASAKSATPPAVRAALEVFLLHVDTVVREQPIVTALLDDLAAVPTGAHVDEFDALLGNEHLATDARSSRYRVILLGFAAALAALLLYAAARLVRNHALLNRANDQLLATNATLEERVQERTRELHATQGELVTTARKAGMAEIANNVLHNVGNVLNSVNVSASLAIGLVRDSKAHGLSQVVRLLDKHSQDLGDFLDNDPRGKIVPAYLGSLVDALQLEKRRVIEELELLSKRLEHIKDIVASQQTHAGSGSFVEAVDVRTLVEDAVRMNLSPNSPDPTTVVRRFAEVPRLLLDKPRLLQILVNLIANARQAMATMVREAHLTLGIDISDDGRRLTIRVTDEGEGIPQENLTRIFSHGFTTRKNGHGFGLHSCILTAKAMGGSLIASSDGPGLGATFTLELPMRLADVN